jgi:hypothetical protein
MNKDVLDYLQKEDLVYPWNMIAEEVGIEPVRAIFRKLPSSVLYVPNVMRRKEVLRRYVRDNCPNKSVRELAYHLEISPSFAYKVVRRDCPACAGQEDLFGGEE